MDNITSNIKATKFRELIEKLLATKTKVRNLTSLEHQLIDRKNRLQDKIILLEEYDQWLLEFEQTNAQLENTRVELTQLLAELSVIESELRLFPFPARLYVNGVAVWKENGSICIGEKEQLTTTAN